MSIYEKLFQIQMELKAPKSQYNSFGKYHYRNCEDILEALKSTLKNVKATVTISDEIVNIVNRFYVKATARVIDLESGEQIESTAYAREPENKKGLDESQITGSASSYARKYALNGLFAIDDTKDSDYALDQKIQTKNQENKYVCCDCGAPFSGFTDKNGKKWSAGQTFHFAEKANEDGKARCKTCRLKKEVLLSAQQRETHGQVNDNPGA